MYQSTYFLERSSNTFADNLAAFGLAFVLQAIVDNRAEIRLEDRGQAFAVVCEPGIEEAWVEEWRGRFFAGAPMLATFINKIEAKGVSGATVDLHGLPIGDVVVDYESERENYSRFFEWFKALPAGDKAKAAQGEVRGPVAPHPDWDLFRAVNPAALQVYNKLQANWWQVREAFPDVLRILLGMTAQMPNRVEEAEKAWTKLSKERGWKIDRDATASQLFNPTQGKGTNSTKTTWRGPGNMKNFWLLEWLKVVGLRYGGLTRQVGGSKDRKTYVLAPQHLAWRRHTEIMIKFRRAMSGRNSAVKMDNLAALRYTQALLEHFEEARAEDLEAGLYGRRASDLVRGLDTAFYKDMGNAVVIMNVAALNLPGWVAPRDREDLAQLHDALDEHVLIVRALDESRGEQFDLLRFYRDFLSGNDLVPFFAFTTAYSGFIMHQLERRQFVRPFTTTTLEVLFMNSDDTEKTYSQIVQNEGFRNIAYAIRHSTVIPQGQKARDVRPVVDVRYGLGQQLARKAAYPDDFLAELGEFLHLYNAENAQLRENKRKLFRKNVTDADIDALVALIDRFGSKVVCNLLVAYGYAREPYEARDDKSAASAEPEGVGDAEENGDPSEEEDE